MFLSASGHGVLENRVVRPWFLRALRNRQPAWRTRGLTVYESTEYIDVTYGCSSHFRLRFVDCSEFLIPGFQAVVVEPKLGLAGERGGERLSEERSPQSAAAPSLRSRVIARPTPGVLADICHRLKHFGRWAWGGVLCRPTSPPPTVAERRVEEGT